MRCVSYNVGISTDKVICGMLSVEKVPSVRDASRRRFQEVDKK